MKFSKILPSAGVLAMLVTGPAFAQDSAAGADEEIVVTGTSIRGIAPAGSSVIGLSQEDIQSTGALDTNGVLSELPMAANFFNTLAQPGAGPGTNQIAFVPLPRIQLRPLPGQNTGGNMQTLVLIDGHRMAPMGVSLGQPRVVVDSNMIPPGLLERVEVIPDGGSAIYGSDAVTGVINYITRRRFDGVEVTGNYGFADGFERWGHGLTVGTDWGSGSIFGSYNYSQSDALFGRDRDWIRNYPTTPFRQCLDPTVSIATGPNAGTYVVDENGDLVAGSNTCDPTDNRAYSPRTYRYSFAAGFSQDLSETVRFDLRGLIGRSVSIGYSGPITGTSVITSANPNFISNLGTTNQSVSFNYEPVFGPDSGKLSTDEDFWQITPEIAWDLPGDWQFRGMLSHGETELMLATNGLNATNVTAALNSSDPLTALNPYNIADTPDAVLAGLRQTTQGVGQTQFSNARAIADGPLFSVPAGEVRAAVGAEVIKTLFQLRNTAANSSQLGAERELDQDVKAFFVELQVPVVSPEMDIPFVHSLNLQGSARQDTYSDVPDSAFNSAYGVTYEPVEWISLFGNYSESFIAPSPIEQGSSQSDATFGVSTTTEYEFPGDVLATGPVISIGGGVSPLLPQTSESYTVGFEVRPPGVEGLSVRATFWHTLLMGRLAFPARVNPNQFNHGFFDVFPQGMITAAPGGGIYLLNPTPQQIEDIALSLPGGADAVTGVLADYVTGGAETPALLIYDNRQRNLGRALVEGWDLGADYTHPTSWGSWDARISGTIFNLNRQQSGPGAPWIEGQTRTSADYRATVSAGANIGNFRAQGTVNVSGGYTVPAGRVDSYHPLDLFFAYDFEGEGLQQDLRFTVNVNNVFDDEPPGFELNNANGFTLGRLVQFGVSKRF